MKVFKNDRHGLNIFEYSYSDFTPDEDGAQPTSRLLDCDPEDFWAAEEWRENGTLEGVPCSVYYLFSAEEIAENPEDYPWDEEHVSRVIAREED